MATRFYFPFSDVPAISPAFAGWGDTSYAVRTNMYVSKGTSAVQAGELVGPWNDTLSALNRQFISPALAAQTISGTVSMQVLVTEDHVQDNVDQLWMSLRVFSGDGLTLRGTLLSLGNYGPTLEFLHRTMRNKTGADGAALTSVTCQAGDVIVAEFGYFVSGGGNTPYAQAGWGENDTDLPVDETTTTGAGWLEFSADISFNVAAVSTSFVEWIDEGWG